MGWDDECFSDPVSEKIAEDSSIKLLLLMGVLCIELAYLSW